jgi:hypothetical protein
VNRRTFIKTTAGIFVPAIVGLGAVPSHRRITTPSTVGGYSVNPDDFSNLEGWWKADSLSLADGTAVGDTGTEWPDSSGNGNDMAQATSGFRPVFKTSIFGAMPSVRFDGTNDWLAMTGSIVLSASTEYTVLTVSKCNATPVAYCWFQDNAGTQQFYRGDNTCATYNTGGVPWKVSDAFGTAVTSVVAASARRTSSDYTAVQFRENKTARGAGGAGNSNYEWTIKVIGNSLENFPNMDMAELMVWNSFLTNTDMDSLYDNYLKPRWGLP